ncbi:phosphatidylethanolamine-binding protein 4 isoform X2 [Dunckerocampus dactyliophorus]|uniref:phosphatidylethanolamine-binding protein 4 isoform X2 n=1 Tax=Dunckerocampus dactyliophorus TaxID=161453 RepID=UPI002405DBE9|nr:phosphatidylethanolamine-binding protein 4 isoform X2 [Dunckerocampus dactyliophorus]
MIHKVMLPLMLVICGYMWGSHQVEAPADTLGSEDSSFCFGGLEVIYPKLDIDRCLIVPKDIRKKISTVWGAPLVKLASADKRKMYVLVMVDPDAPSRSKPTSANWRHWLVTNIQGGALKTGQLQGTTVTDYHPPTPPQASGFHRYQFMLFEKPPNTLVSLAQRETLARGKWDLLDFIQRFDLGAPVAAVQFLTQNSKD